jgi:hypothetical protein
MAEVNNNDAIFSALAGYLNSIGLGNLFRVVDGKPTGWLWEKVQEGVGSREELQILLEQTPEFQQRFKVIFDMREQVSSTGRGYVPTAEDVLAYEKEYVQTMAAAGLPSWFYDSYQDAHNAMRTNLEVDQIKERIDRGYGLIQEMPREVKDVFAEYYGGDAESVLLAAVLDPDKALRDIDRTARAAQIGGFGRRAGLNIDLPQASYFAEEPLSTQDIEAGIRATAGYMPLTEETIGEAATNLTQETALAAGLGGSAQNEALLETRLLRRQLGQRTTPGGAVAGQSGIAGAGVV